MKLVYFDTFEAGDTKSFGQITSKAEALFFGITRTSSADAGTSGGIAIYAGDLSSRAIFMPSISTSAPDFLGPVASSQVTGKIAFGMAVNKVTVSGTGVVCHVCTGPDFNTSAGFIPVTVTNDTVNFLNEQATIPGFLPNNYFYLEIVIDLDSGTFAAYVNNSLLFDGSHSIAKIFSCLAFTGGAGNSSSNTAIKLDDIYILAGTSGPYSDRLGPVRATRMPLLSSTVTEFTPNGTASNLQAVNKTDFSTATFNRSPASNNKQDRFLVDTSSIPDGKDVFGVQQLVFYRKTDIGDRGLKSVITDENAVNVDSLVLPQNISNFAGGTPHILETVPGGTPLDKDAVALMEFGYEVIAS